jgi:acyl carrier protein
VQTLLNLIRDTVQPEVTISGRTPLLSSGLVDSLSLVLLISAIEEQYDITLEVSELGADNFDTPEQMLEATCTTSRRCPPAAVPAILTPPNRKLNREYYARRCRPCSRRCGFGALVTRSTASGTGPHA